jgi:RNA polymerase sigma-70 factor (ECF subfamily)
VIEDQIRLSALMSRVARGDEAAFAEIYDALAGKVFGLARRVVRDPAQAQEVAQEVMLEVWRKAPRYSSSLGTVSVWILTITHRRAVDRSDPRKLPLTGTRPPQTLGDSFPR